MKNFFIFLFLVFSICLVGCGEEANKNTVPWDGKFYGIQLPQPKGYEKALRIKVIDPSSYDKGSTIVYIEGMKFVDYLEYSKVLKALPGWKDVYISIKEQDPESDVSTCSGRYNEEITVGAFFIPEKRVKKDMEKNPKESYNFYLMVGKLK